MKLHQTFAASAIALCVFGVGGAKATVTWTSTGYTDAANLAGTTVIDDFDSTSPAAGYTFTSSLGTIGLNNGSTGLYNASFGEAAMPPGTSGNYFAVLGDGATATLTSLTGPLTRISLLWGSIDTYNTIEFIGGTNTSITGTQILATNLNYSGNQSAEQSNREVEFFIPEADGVTQINFLSASNSFEFDNITAGVPEPATWAMFLVGFGAIGWTLRGSRKSAAVTA